MVPRPDVLKVLIIGAGTGSDVAIALAHGANHVDAVEIDPKIQQLGVQLHPTTRTRPAGQRSHRRRSRLPSQVNRQIRPDHLCATDSLTSVSTAANVRLKLFLFTPKDCESRQHLTDSGVFVLYDYYREPWLLEKLNGMIHDAFGPVPLFRTWSGAYAAFADGPAVAALPAGEPDPGTISALRATARPPTPGRDLRLAFPLPARPGHCPVPSFGARLRRGIPPGDAPIVGSRLAYLYRFS